MELPAQPEVLLRILFLGQPPQVAQGLLHRHDLLPPNSASTEIRCQALEAEAGGIDLLEVLAGEPAHDRTPRRRDGHEALALELAQRGANGSRRDAELLCEVALNERRFRRKLAVDDQLAQRQGYAVLDRLAVFERRDRGGRGFHVPTVCSMLARNAICYFKSQMSLAARIGVDVGGTFTDVILHEADGRVRVHKLLSTPPSYDRAVVAAVSGLVNGGAAAGVAEVVHGTTVATNAVLERLGAETALLTTRHFRDVLELRRLRIPHMYDLFWRKPPPLVDRRLRFEVSERMAADGTIVTPLDEEEVRRLAGRLQELGIDAVAVCFLHSYLYPEHEQRVGAILADSSRTRRSRFRARSCASSASTSGRRPRS